MIRRFNNKNSNYPLFSQRKRQKNLHVSKCPSKFVGFAAGCWVVVVDEADVVGIVTDVLDVGAITRYGIDLSSGELLRVEVNKCGTILSIFCKNGGNIVTQGRFY